MGKEAGREAGREAVKKTHKHKLSIQAKSYSITLDDHISFESSIAITTETNA